MPTNGVEPTADELAGLLVRRLSPGLGMIRRMINTEMNMEPASALECEAQALMLMGEDRRPFCEAFKEKRQPELIGR